MSNTAHDGGAGERGESPLAKYCPRDRQPCAFREKCDPPYDCYANEAIHAYGEARTDPWDHPLIVLWSAAAMGVWHVVKRIWRGVTGNPLEFVHTDLPSDSLSWGARKLFRRRGCLGCDYALCDECDRDNPQRMESTMSERFGDQAGFHHDEHGPAQPGGQMREAISLGATREALSLPPNPALEELAKRADAAVKPQPSGMILPVDAKERKNAPVASGVIDYFPRAIVAVANLSRVGNEQHNPGQPLHWAKEKSTDHADCIGRHMIDRGTMDGDGVRHSAKVAWRALALLEIELLALEGDQEAIRQVMKHGTAAHKRALGA